MFCANAAYYNLHLENWTVVGGLREVIRRGRAGVKYERIRVMKTAGERKNLIRRR